MNRWITAALIAALCAAAPPAAAGTVEDALVEQIRATESPWDKDQLAVQLARRGTPDARDALLGLLEDPDAYNRAAAVDGLVLLQDDAVTEALLDRLETDWEIAYDIEDGLRAHTADHFDGMALRYGRSANAETRALLVDILGRSGDPRAADFLKTVIEDRHAADRVVALQLLSEVYPRGNLEYVRGWLDDPALRPVVLRHLVREGTSADLPVFLELIETERDPETLLLCYDAVDRWGSSEQRREVYADALVGGSEGLAYGAMLTFDGVYSEAIEQALIDWTRRGTGVELRLSAAGQLGRYGDEDVIPVLIAALDESYQPPPETPFWSGVFGVLTVGILPIFEGIARRWDARDFEARKAEVAAGLTRLTGQHLGTDYEAWREWAVFEGYTVDGANLIQYLYSAYPETRERATRSACRVLGYRNVQGYYQQHPELAGQDESVLLVALTGELLENGVLVDEER